jgi:hypothetical protein
MKQKKEEIMKAIDDLRNAIIADMEASQKEEQSKTEKIKTHHHLLLAKETFNSIEY